MKNIILVFLLLLYVMMSCDNAVVDKKTSGSDTTLCICIMFIILPDIIRFISNPAMNCLSIL